MNLRIPMNGQGKHGGYRPKKSQQRRSTTPSKLEVKEDLVKSEKMKTFITENAPRFIHMTLSCFLMLTLILHIKSVSLVVGSSPHFDHTPCQTNSNSTRIAISHSPNRVHHQVFLNFRGKQLRYNFVSHLSDALKRHDIEFFIDKFEQRGRDLKGKLTVIPIFYKVDPGDVGKPTGDSKFGRAFLKLAESSTGDKVKKWKDALESISNKMGLTLGDKSSESDFLYEILTEIKRVREAIGLEEQEKPFWWKNIKRKVSNLSYYKLAG